MTSKQRVQAAMRFGEPDRVPRYWQDFWPEFQARWRDARGTTDLHAYFGDDIRLVRPDETAWPTRAAVLRREGDQAVVRSGWGETKRTTWQESYGQQIMGQLIEPAVADRVDVDRLRFDDPALDSRYTEAAEQVREWKEQYYVLTKTGGPYLRAAFMRGEEAFWIDVAEDPGWAKAFVDRVADHIIAVGVESLRRFGLQDTGIAIYDDVAASWGPFVGPANYEKIFLPALRRMVRAYRDAGAAVVMHHADGNVVSLLDMWVDAGIDAINPVEFRSGMDPVAIREKYERKLVCVGGLDNGVILPRGDRAEIRDHVLHLLGAGVGGGFVIGPHSIGPDISPETMDYVLELLETHGNYPLPRRDAP